MGDLLNSRESSGDYRSEYHVTNIESLNWFSGNGALQVPSKVKGKYNVKWVNRHKLTWNINWGSSEELLVLNVEGEDLSACINKSGN